MEKDKRYLVFLYEEYYPNGGINDCMASFDDVDDAKKYIAKEMKSGNYQYWDLYDREEGVQVD